MRGVHTVYSRQREHRETEPGLLSTKNTQEKDRESAIDRTFGFVYRETSSTRPTAVAVYTPQEHAIMPLMPRDRPGINEGAHNTRSVVLNSFRERRSTATWTVLEAIAVRTIPYGFILNTCEKMKKIERKRQTVTTPFSPCRLGRSQFGNSIQRASVYILYIPYTL